MIHLFRQKKVLGMATQNNNADKEYNAKLREQITILLEKVAIPLGNSHLLINLIEVAGRGTDGDKYVAERCFRYAAVVRFTDLIGT